MSAERPPADTLPGWRPLLRAAREREGRAPAARWLQLATVAADGTPRVRTLVFRGWAGPTSLDLLSDSRSAKADQLIPGAAFELCWLLPKARSQFRLRGRRLALPADLEQHERQRHWRQLTPSGRAVWGWPAPGQPLQAGAAFPAELAEEADCPDALLLLRLEIAQVELLELGPHPHRRRRWRAAEGWRQQDLNP